MLLSLWRHRSRVFLAVLALAMVIAVAACQQSSPANTARQTATTAASSSSTGRNHVPAGSSPQWVQVTFTTSTSYTQAHALITSVGEIPYPWACNPLYDVTPTPIAGQMRVWPATTPAPSPLQDTPEVFAVTHHFILGYPRQPHLDQLAASNLVTSVDVVQLPHCTV